MRPKIKRHICTEHCAKFSLFKPNGIPAAKLKSIKIAADEFEAIRLVDLMQFSQQDAAQEMQVSRQTFANILKCARRKITSALVNGDALQLRETNTLSVEFQKE
ncbi:MAG: DUF134 domain-containing protein [Psychromonas sp.]|nr:DUF134 domain-containing protein [Psychromonas sp.]